MEVISPWTLYWILQLDTISTAVGLLSFLGAILVPFAWGFSIDVFKSVWAYVLCGVLTLFWLIAVALAIFLPSTKTMAAIVVIPAIANSTTIQTEAGELYDLAKQALRQAVADDKPAKSDESK